MEATKKLSDRKAKDMELAALPNREEIVKKKSQNQGWSIGPRCVFRPKRPATFGVCNWTKAQGGTP